MSSPFDIQNDRTTFLLVDKFLYLKLILLIILLILSAYTLNREQKRNTNIAMVEQPENSKKIQRKKFNTDLILLPSIQFFFFYQIDK